MTWVRPDGGWGWVVVCAAFFSNVIVDGVKYSFGIIFIELLGTFQQSKGATSLIMSLQTGALAMTGPLNAALVNRFGCRIVCMIGTLIAFVGFFASVYATSVLWLYITFGLIGGVGFCLLVMPPAIMVARYFDGHLSKAIGMGMMGSGAGSLIFIPLSKTLIDAYTWRGMLMLEAGFVLNGLICAFVLRPAPRVMDVDLSHDPARDTPRHHEYSDIIDSEANNAQMLQKESEKMIETFVTKGAHELNGDVSERNRKTLLKSSEHKQPSVEINHKPTNSETRWLSLTPLRNPAFLIYIFSNFLAELALSAPFAFLPDMMMHKGFTRDDGMWILFLAGVMSTVARLVIGFVGDLRFVKRVYLCNCLLVANGIINILAPFCNNYAAFVVFAVTFGFTAGGMNVMRCVLVPDLFGVEMVADCFGIMSFFSGMAALAGLPKAGALFDATGSYVATFVTSGCELILSGVLVFTIPIVLNAWKRRQELKNS